MQQITVSTKSTTYPVYIGNGIRHESLGYITHLQSISKVFIVTDDIVSSLYLDDVNNAFSRQYEVLTFVIPNGEGSKSFSIYQDIITFAIEHNLDRQTLIIALGGGVVGDLAGFVAATYLRGVRFIQMPTTLLAHDSSVGGKVAINHHLGKNLIGAFYQPSAILYDVATLQTLPRNQYLSGLAEIIKLAFIHDVDFLSLLQKEGANLLCNEELLIQIITRAISIKGDIVRKDEKEHDIRMHLNFGHTLAHAIETEIEYDILHGEAVAIGMLFAMAVSEYVFNVKLPIISMKNWFDEIGLKTKVPKRLTCDQLIRTMLKDKKVRDGQINMVLLKAIGQPKVVQIDNHVLHTLLKKYMND
jgi:3-dehydroquinate synthase